MIFDLNEEPVSNIIGFDLNTTWNDECYDDSSIGYDFRKEFTNNQVVNGVFMEETTDVHLEELQGAQDINNDEGDVGASNNQNFGVASYATQNEELLDNEANEDGSDADIDYNQVEGSDGVESIQLQDVCFRTMDEANSFIRHYAVESGFKFRLVRTRKNSKNVPYTLDYCCHRQGSKKVATRDNVTFRRQTRRCGCAAKIRLKKQCDETWKCVLHDRQHNHPFLPLHMRHLLHGYKDMTIEQCATILSMVESGMRIIDTYRFFNNEAGGPEYSGLRSKLIYNTVKKMRADVVSKGDANALLAEFRECSRFDPDFFYKYQTDENDSLTNFFWRDGQMKADYRIFGDFISLDATYRTNRYNMFCVPIVGANHHRQTICFGMAFLVELTTNAYEWLLRTFLASMDGVEPRTIFSDEEQGFIAAFDRVMQHTRHRLCLWHIAEKAPTKLKKFYHQDGFRELFMKWLYDCITEDELNLTWTKMSNTFNCGDNSWLKRLWGIRSRWALCLSRDFFSAGTLATQRSESTNSVLTSLANKQMGLHGVFKAFGTRMKEWRIHEVESDYENSGVRKPVFPHRFLRHASRVYTYRIYKDFEQQFKFAMSAKFRPISVDGTIESYIVSSGDQSSREFVVKFDRAAKLVDCECKFFTQQGFLCSHAIRVLDITGTEIIPDQYIIKRWTKSARSGSHFIMGGGNDIARLGRFCWRAHMIREYVTLIDKALHDPELRKKLELSLQTSKETFLGSQPVTTSVPIGNVVRDPKFVSSNNFGKKRTKSLAEKARSKRRK